VVEVRGACFRIDAGCDEEAREPNALMQALERHRVTYVIVGGLGRVIHGSDEIADGLRPRPLEETCVVSALRSKT
jgi:hypothetical protein